MKYNPNLPLDKQKAKVYFNKIIEGNANIEIKVLRETRTLSQNNYLHVVISLAAINYGYTKKECKELFKKRFNWVYEKFGDKFLMETSKMTTDELSLFIDQIRTHCSMDGCYIPTADEYKFNWIEIEKEIDRNKEFL